MVFGAVLSVGVVPGRRRLGGFCLKHKLKLAPLRKMLSKLKQVPKEIAVFCKDYHYFMMTLKNAFKDHRGDLDFRCRFIGGRSSGEKATRRILPNT